MRLTSFELRLDEAAARQTADDIETVLDAIAGGVIDCCSGHLERILVDLQEAVEAIARGQAGAPG